MYLHFDSLWSIVNFASYSALIYRADKTALQNDLVTCEYLDWLFKIHSKHYPRRHFVELSIARREASNPDRVPCTCDLNRDALSKETREKHCIDHVDVVGGFRSASER